MFLVIGIAIKYYKAYWLISGYNTMSKEKKKNVDIENLGILMGNLSFVLAVIFLSASVLILVKQMFIASTMFFLIIPLSIYIVIKAQAYDKNTKNPDGTTKTGTKVTIGLVVVFLILTSVGIGVVLYHSSKPAECFLEDETLRISGLYGEEIKLSEIISVTIKGHMPEIKYKSNGSSLGSMKKGYFKLEDIGRTKLFVDEKKPPFIFIEMHSGLRIINTDEASKTEKLYKDLLEAWEKTR